MKTLIIVVVLVAVAVVSWAFAKRNAPPSNPIDTTSFYELSITGIDGNPLAMSDFKGKYVLCVNVASKCGFTPQYEALEKLYEEHKDQLVIVGFPCNQFLNQEPGTNEEIVSFCQKNYGVTFPLTEKIDVKGSDQHPIYQWLTNKDLNGVESNKVKWNFHKFLISPEGQWLASFGSSTDPLDEAIVSLIK
ncbi:MAG: glutathione peroxidase [Flavobacteriales bacterium]|nr:glutathione peroxidase [Flavobacteriales bacterium]